MENLKANSSSRLETRGLQWYDSAALAGFNAFKNSGSLEGKITRPRRLLVYRWNFKRPSEEFRLTMIIPFYNPAQGKSVSHKALKFSISGSTPGSRWIHYSQVWVVIKIKGTKESLLQSATQTYVPCFNDHWGRIVFESSLTPLARLPDRIRIRVVKKVSRSFGGFLFKHI